MKAEIIKEDVFTPIKISITIENSEELTELRRLLIGGMTQSVGELYDLLDNCVKDYLKD